MDRAWISHFIHTKHNITQSTLFKILLLNFHSISCQCIQDMWCLLTHWGRMTHICIGNLTIIGSDNGLLSEQRQAIIWTNAGISLIEPLVANFSEISIGIQTFSFKKMNFKMSSVKWRPFCLGLNLLKYGLLHVVCQYHVILDCVITGLWTWL